METEVKGTVYLFVRAQKALCIPYPKGNQKLPAAFEDDCVAAHDRGCWLSGAHENPDTHFQSEGITVYLRLNTKNHINKCKT